MGEDGDLTWSGHLVQSELKKNGIPVEKCYYNQEDYVHFRKGNIIIEFEEDNPKSYQKYRKEKRIRRKNFKRKRMHVVRVSCNSLFWRTGLTLEKMVAFVQKPPRKQRLLEL